MNEPLLLQLLERTAQLQTEAVINFRLGLDATLFDAPHEYNWFRLQKRINAVAETCQAIRTQLLEPRK